MAPPKITTQDTTTAEKGDDTRHDDGGHIKTQVPQRTEDISDIPEESERGPVKHTSEMSRRNHS